MLKQILLVLFLMSVFLCAGCAEKTPVETATSTTTTTLETGGESGVTAAMTEDQVFDAIEQEMEETAGDMSLNEIEDTILE